jgi:Ca2+-binding EF-hand superfamily protein
MAAFDREASNVPVLRAHSIQLAELHQECIVCYDQLYKQPVCQLVNDESHRVCSHLFHQDCIEGWADQVRDWTEEDDEDYYPPESRRCPMCRADFCEAVLIPDLKIDSRAWFNSLDENGDGSLTYPEIIDGLKGQVPLDWTKIECDVDKLWIQWDKDGNGSISYEEFADEETGVFAYLMKNYPANPRADPPNLIEDYEGWFDYWDEDNSGSLDKAEVTRALIKTFRMYDMRQTEVRTIVNAVWAGFDTDNSGTIDRHEFLAPDGLAEAFSAQMDFENENRVQG